jgi:hypothetical protein
MDVQFRCNSAVKSKQCAAYICLCAEKIIGCPSATRASGNNHPDVDRVAVRLRKAISTLVSMQERRGTHA